MGRDVPRNIFDQEQHRISQRTGLAESTVSDLRNRGWTFEEREGQPSRWVSPQASLPQHIPHEEPQCTVCPLLFPHKHGLTCSTSCPECRGICHPSCPAYKEMPSG